MTTLIDLTFKGIFSNIDFTFLKKVISQKREMNFNSPENTTVSTFDDIMNVFASNEYVDFTISSDSLDIYHINIIDVFINIACDNENFDMLLFFDLKDLNNDFYEGLDNLYHWSMDFKNKYNFESFICQTDGVNTKEDYYFNSDGKFTYRSK